MWKNTQKNNTVSSAQERTTSASANVIWMSWAEYDKYMREISSTQHWVKSHSEKIIDKK